MNTSIKKIILPQQSDSVETQENAPNGLHFIHNMEVPCSIRLGTLTLTVAELRQLQTGQTLELLQKTHEPVEVILNNHVIARGDLVSCDEHFAVQITEVCC